MNNNIFFLFFLSIVLLSCHKIPQEIEPKLSYQIDESFIKSLPGAFPALNEMEKKEDFGKEYDVAVKFAHDLDFYRAITSFKRASYLLDNGHEKEKLSCDYSILLCYYLGQKYEEVIFTFERSPLIHVNKENFKPFKDLLIILYDSYKKIKEEQKSQNMLKALELNYPELKKKLEMTEALLKADTLSIEKASSSSSDKNEILSQVHAYKKEKKSIYAAQALNALLPGAGYWYLGQRQSALTAFLINGVFIYASYEFFHKGYIGAGIIFSSLEFGWYFGGIYGAGLETKVYNERLYEKKFNPLMNKKGYFPVCYIEYAF